MKRKINNIAIHCTGTPQTATVQGIQRFWREKRGWRDPGYHILIEPNGTRHYLQPFDKISNGVKGFNSDTINIAYIGGIDSQERPIDNRTEAQKASLLTSIREAIEYAGGKPTIQGHRDFPNVKKACPSFDAKKEYAWINL